MRAADPAETALALAEAETGIRRPGSKLRLCVSSEKSCGRLWTKAEDNFLRENLGRITEHEIARQLGRTPVAVHIRWGRDLHLPAPSKRPDVISAEQVAIGMGVDGKSIHILIDRGILPGRRLPTNGRVIRLLDRQVLVKWLLDPENWAYFDPARVGQLRVRGIRRITDGYDFGFWEDVAKTVLAARKKWKNEWLSAGQVAERMRTTSGCINRAILKGTLKATRWGNWRIKKSELVPGKVLNAKGDWVTSVRRVRQWFGDRNSSGGRKAFSRPEDRLTLKQLEILQEIRRARRWIIPVRVAQNLGRQRFGSAWSAPTCLQLVSMGFLERKKGGWYRPARGRKN